MTVAVLSDAALGSAPRRISPDQVTLDDLIAPVSPAEFLDRYWERDVLVVERDQPELFSDFLTHDTIDRIVGAAGLNGDTISMVDAKREITPEDYLFPSGMVDPVRVFDLFAGGATIVLQQLHLRHDPLAQLCRAMEARFGHRFQTNIYFTPAGSAQGFRPHWDSHDVFVLQVAGSKAWKIYDTPMEIPDRTVHFDPKSYELGAVTREFTLNAGDIAYVPRGVVHDAQSTDEMSIHITLGVMATTWRDALHAAVDALSLKDRRIREALPPGYHTASGLWSTSGASDRAGGAETDSGAVDAMRAVFSEIVERLGRDTDMTDVLGEFADDLAETRMALAPGQLSAIAALPSLTGETCISVRPNVIHRFDVGDGDTVLIYAFGRVLKFPAHARTELEAAMASSATPIASLPGDLDTESKVVLVRRLVREGLVSAS